MRQTNTYLLVLLVLTMLLAASVAATVGDWPTQKIAESVKAMTASRSIIPEMTGSSRCDLPSAWLS